MRFVSGPAQDICCTFHLPFSAFADDAVKPRTDIPAARHRGQVVYLGEEETTIRESLQNAEIERAAADAATGKCDAKTSALRREFVVLPPLTDLLSLTRFHGVEVYGVRFERQQRPVLWIQSFVLVCRAGLRHVRSREGERQSSEVGVSRPPAHFF